MFTVPEVAELLGRPRREIYSWIGSGQLQRLPLGATVRISRYTAQLLAEKLSCDECSPCGWTVSKVAFVSGRRKLSTVGHFAWA